MKITPTDLDFIRRLTPLVIAWTGGKPRFSRLGKTSPGSSPAHWACEVDGLVLIAAFSRDGSVAPVTRAVASLDGAVSEKCAHPVVVVPYMGARGRSACETAGISWIDLSGNANLQVSTGSHRLVIRANGHDDVFRHRGRPSNPFAPKASRLARFLIDQVEGEATQAELVRDTGLDAGHVSRVMRRLEADGMIARRAGGRWHVLDRALLLDAWAEADAFAHHALPGHVPGRTGEERTLRLAHALEARNVEYALTGLAAGWAYTHAAGFRTVSCFVNDAGQTADLVAALDEAGFREDSAGPNVRILVPSDHGVFHGARPVHGMRFVCPAQAYVDLGHEPERSEEFRKAVRAVVMSRG